LSFAGSIRHGVRRSRQALGGALLVVVVAGAACRAPRDPARVNVILVSIDTLRADRLNAYGYRARTTSPEIDRLATDGVLFENHISSSPWTVPSHLSLLTSLHPTSHGVTTSFQTLKSRIASGAEYDRLPDDVVTLAEALAATGRATAAFTGGVTLNPGIGFGQGFESYETSMFKLSSRKMAAMLSWVERRGEQPFFLFWHTFEVHAPYLNPVFLGEAVPGDKANAIAHALAKLGRARGEKSMREGRRILARHGAYTREACQALYDGGVRSVDQWVGLLVSRLRERGLYDRTLIVLTSDHGEQIGEHMGRGDEWTPGRGIYNTHGHTLYEELVRVPLIVKLPNQRYAGRRVSAVTSAIDVMPTILEVAGAAEQAPQAQGASLRRLWDGRSGRAASPPAFSESLSLAREKKSVRTDRYKYIISIDETTVRARGRDYIPDSPTGPELYDLSSDPGERHNLLAGQGKLPPVAVALDRALRRAASRRGQAAKGGLDAEALEDLRALGYIQ
jgi:arylsulfatase A-like enzyme